MEIVEGCCPPRQEPFPGVGIRPQISTIRASEVHPKTTSWLYATADDSAHCPLLIRLISGCCCCCSTSVQSDTVCVTRCYRTSATQLPVFPSCLETCFFVRYLFPPVINLHCSAAPEPRAVRLYYYTVELPFRTLKMIEFIFFTYLLAC